MIRISFRAGWLAAGGKLPGGRKVTSITRQDVQPPSPSQSVKQLKPLLSLSGNFAVSFKIRARMGNIFVYLPTQRLEDGKRHLGAQMF
jgi:hypothetical protein